MTTRLPFPSLHSRSLVPREVCVGGVSAGRDGLVWLWWIGCCVSCGTVGKRCVETSHSLSPRPSPIPPSRLPMLQPCRSSQRSFRLVRLPFRVKGCPFMSPSTCSPFLLLASLWLVSHSSASSYCASRIHCSAPHHSSHVVSGGGTQLSTLAIAVARSLAARLLFYCARCACT